MMDAENAEKSEEPLATAPTNNRNERTEPAELQVQYDEDLRLVADSALDFAMIFTDPERKVVRWSKGAENVLGWTEDEAVGKDERDLIFTPEDQVQGIPQQEPDTALREGRAIDNRWHMKKDGTRFFAVGVVTPLYNPKTGALRGFGKVFHDQTTQKRLEEELQRTNETLEARVADRTKDLEALLTERQDLLRRLVTTQEQERRRISHELHDQTGQHLTGLSLRLKALETVVQTHGAPNSEAHSLLATLRGIAEELASDIHRIAVELRPTSLDDLGLVPALRSHLERWSETSGVHADFESVEVNRRLPELVETTVYRVVQEALTNITRHASGDSGRKATRVSVTLQRFAVSLQATVEDNGPGFDLRAAAQRGRLGLAGMQERAEACGGILEIETAPGEGTTVFLRVPVELP